MNKNQNQIYRLSILALMSALCYIGFQFFRIDIPLGENSTAIHFGNIFCVLAALILGGVPGGIAGAVGMGLADLMNPLYVTSAPQTMVLKMGIGCITGLVAHRIGHIRALTDSKQLTKWTILSCLGGMGFNVIADPIVSYFYKNLVLGIPSSSAKIFAAWTAGATLFNAVVSVIVASALYLALRKSTAHTSLGKRLFK